MVGSPVMFSFLNAVCLPILLSGNPSVWQPLPVAHGTSQPYQKIQAVRGHPSPPTISPRRRIRCGINICRIRTYRQLHSFDLCTIDLQSTTNDYWIAKFDSRIYPRCAVHFSSTVHTDLSSKMPDQDANNIADVREGPCNV